MNFENTFFAGGDSEEIHKNLHRTAVLYRGIASGLINSFTFDDIDRLLTVQGIGHPYIFLLNSKHGIKKMPFYPYTEIFHRVFSPTKTIKQYMSDGTTVFIHDLHRHHPVIAATHQYVKQKLKYLDKTVCFLSPPNSQATKPHADDHPNLVVQISGRKHWQVWKEIDEEELGTKRSVKEADEWLSGLTQITPPIVDKALNPGDVLVVPQRFLHTAWTLNEHSLSIVFQIRCCNFDHTLRNLYATQKKEVGMQSDYTEVF